jgi:hypothetical protein
MDVYVLDIYVPNFKFHTFPIYLPATVYEWKLSQFKFDLLEALNISKPQSMPEKKYFVDFKEKYTGRGPPLAEKLVPTFVDRGVSRGQYNGSPRPLSSL